MRGTRPSAATDPSAVTLHNLADGCEYLMIADWDCATLGSIQRFLRLVALRPGRYTLSAQGRTLPSTYPNTPCRDVHVRAGSTVHIHPLVTRPHAGRSAPAAEAHASHTTPHRACHLCGLMLLHRVELIRRCGERSVPRTPSGETTPSTPKCLPAWSTASPVHPPDAVSDLAECDAPVEGLEGAPTAPVGQRTVHIKFLPSDMSDGDMRRIFFRCGRVCKVRIVHPQEEQAGRSFKIAFVEYATAAGAQNALELSSMSIDRFRLQVELAKRPIQGGSPTDATTHAPNKFGLRESRVSVRRLR